MTESTTGPKAPATPRGGYRHGHRAAIPEETLTFREKKVLAAVRASDEPLTVQQLARQCFPGMRSKPGRYESERADGTNVRDPMGAAYRAVLNQLRRLVVGGFVAKTARGTYRALAANTQQPAPEPSSTAATTVAPVEPSPTPAPTVTETVTTARTKRNATPITDAPSPPTPSKESKMILKKGLHHAALASLFKVIDRHSSMPALTHVRIATVDGVARLTATDITTTVTTTIPTDGSGISACLPAKALLDFVKPEGRADRDALVELKIVENDQVVVAVEGAMTTLATIPITDYPNRPGDKFKPTEWKTQATYASSEFSDKLSWVLLAVGLDETRRHLTGVLFAENDVVACDGHRLHMAALPGMSAGPTLVPSKAVATILGVLPKKGDVMVARAGDVLRFTAGDWIVETQVMVDVTFPPYAQVIPHNEQFVAVLERDRLSTSLSKLVKRTSKTHGVRATWNGSLKLERDDDTGKATSTVPFVSTTHVGDDVVAGFNGRYLVDAVSAGDTQVTARVGHALDPLRLDVGSGRLAVVMPMRL